MGKLDGKVALVSGSGRGIGRAIAEKLAGDGAKVVVNDLDPDPAKDTVAAIETAGGAAVSCAGSVTEEGFAERFVGTAVDTFGGLDIIVNNAGYTWDSVIQKMSDDQWDAILDVHLKAPFRILRAAQPIISAATKKEKAAGLVVPCRKVLDRGYRWQRGPGQLLLRQGWCHRPDQGVVQGVGPLQRHSQRSGLRPDPDPTDRGSSRRRRQDRHPGQAAGRRGQPGTPGIDVARHPAGTCGYHGRRRRGGLPVLHPRVELRQRSGRCLRRRVHCLRSASRNQDVSPAPPDPSAAMIFKLVDVPRPRPSRDADRSLVPGSIRQAKWAIRGLLDAECEVVASNAAALLPGWKAGDHEN
jgi:short chain dehydrogenase